MLRAVASGFNQLMQALRRARWGIATIAGAYLLAVVVGAWMAHAGNRFARDRADRLTMQARASSPILRALRQGKRVQAAALDGGANLLGGIASTLAGYWAPGAYPVALYRGWIGGIVSIDRKGQSRLADRAEATYYLITMLLQLIPYSLAGGAGVNLGVARVRAGNYSGPKWVGIPREAWLDAARIYILIIPLFALASTFEMLMR